MLKLISGQDKYIDFPFIISLLSEIHLQYSSSFLYSIIVSNYIYQEFTKIKYIFLFYASFQFYFQNATTAAAAHNRPP